MFVFLTSQRIFGIITSRFHDEKKSVIFCTTTPVIHMQLCILTEWTIFFSHSYLLWWHWWKSEPLQVQRSFRMNFKSSEELNIDLEVLPDIHSSGKTDLGIITNIYFLTGRECLKSLAQNEIDHFPFTSFG